MAYVQHTSWRDRPGAVIAVIAIHAAVGYALVNGLSFTQIVKAIDNPDAIDVVVPIIPPPPPEQRIEPEPAVEQVPLVAPLPPVDLAPQRPPIDATVNIPPFSDVVPKVIASPTPGPTARPALAFDPVAARPRNDPGSWVTESDYRSSWINRGMVGVTRFRLDLAADGRVQSCAITGSSGYAELDKATCTLVTRRARFDPATDGMGAKVSGSYSSSVRWQLPE